MKSTESKSRRLPIRGQNVLLALSIFIFSLLIGEVMLRLFLPLHLAGSNDDYIYDAERGYTVKPGHRLILKDYQLEMYANKMGTLNFQEKFNDYQHLIFAVGDSNTQGVGVPADASFPFQLDLLLNMDEDGIYRKKYGIVNLGVAGGGGEQNLITLNRYIVKLGKPALILYLGSDNDFGDDIWFKSGNVHKSIVEGSPYWGRLYYPAKWILVDTEIGKRLKLLVSTMLMNMQRRMVEKSNMETRPNTEIAIKNSDMTSRSNAGIEIKKSDTVSRSTAEMESDVLKKIIETARLNGIPVILSWADETPSYKYSKRWAQENRIAFADWLTSLNSISRAIPALRPRNPHSGGHYRVYVNQVIASAYAKEIKKMIRDSL